MTFGKGCHLHLIDGVVLCLSRLPRAAAADAQIRRVAHRCRSPGFCNMLQRYINSDHGSDAPTHVAVIFDKGSHTFRNDLYDAYKANRDEMPADLRPQIPLNAHRQRGLQHPPPRNWKGSRPTISSPRWPARRARLADG